VSAKRVNVAIIGAGLMGREVAAAIQRWPALIDHPVRPRLTAVCDINESALEWFDEIDTVTTKVTDYKDLLSDASIDVIYVAVRHDLHERIYSDVIAAGKSLLPKRSWQLLKSTPKAS
jgi:predicted dehydrogenase